MITDGNTDPQKGMTDNTNGKTWVDTVLFKNYHLNLFKSGHSNQSSSDAMWYLIYKLNIGQQ